MLGWSGVRSSCVRDRADQKLRARFKLEAQIGSHGELKFSGSDGNLPRTGHIGRCPKQQDCEQVRGGLRQRDSRASGSLCKPASKLNGRQRESLCDRIAFLIRTAIETAHWQGQPAPAQHSPRRTREMSPCGAALV